MCNTKVIADELQDIYMGKVIVGTYPYHPYPDIAPNLYYYYRITVYFLSMLLDHRL